MPTIKVKCTRDKNRIQDFDFEDYIFGVVASEIGNAPLEACKAQAVAARTTALPYLINNKIISDTSVQAFRAERVDASKYPNAKAGTEQTSGEALYFNGVLLSPCSFSASNGGRTTSSEERWGGYRSYLIEQEDPYDYAVTHGKKTGHGVGMSQEGAKEMARQGFSYQDILSFYYPNTKVLRGAEEAMATNTVKASYQVEKFKYMADKKWKYVAGGAKAGEVDCSGAFTYWYKQADSYMYHGSNSMWRKYSAVVGKIGEIDLVPGMAVYKIRDWKSSESGNPWYKTEPGDVYHVGLYIGNDQVVEAKGTRYGVVYSKLKEWTHASRLKYTEYDLDENGETAKQVFPAMGVVVTESGKLNVRKKPNTTSTVLDRIPKGDMVTLTGYEDGWYSLEYNGHNGYVSSEYICVSSEAPAKAYVITFMVANEAMLEELAERLSEMGIVPEVREAGD